MVDVQKLKADIQQARHRAKAREQALDTEIARFQADFLTLDELLAFLNLPKGQVPSSDQLTKAIIAYIYE